MLIASWNFTCFFSWNFERKESSTAWADKVKALLYLEQEPANNQHKGLADFSNPAIRADSHAVAAALSAGARSGKFSRREDERNTEENGRDSSGL
jgi:hypothetical protein